MAVRPECSKCGSPHWRFVACENAVEVAASEDANAEKREAAKVYPQWRNASGGLQGTNRSWTTNFKRG